MWFGWEPQNFETDTQIKAINCHTVVDLLLAQEVVTFNAFTLSFVAIKLDYT